ncbi:RHS repeat-associated core domain-containing protein [Pseudomonas sp. MAG733B]|uniref:RHS repeat-associated core domain-containing protein n=1 Tax=Pseudomonas sp. MAG733B TaxID=3122079 RepID=UPI0030D2CA56
MLPDRETFLSRYHYDARDQLIDSTPSTQPPIRRFYLKDRLATEIQGTVQRSIMQHDDQLLAQQLRQNGAVEAHLLATDQQRSALNVLDVTRPHPIAYTPYGHRPAENGLLSLLGFNGERADPVTGCYLLGNGYRAFNPVLMRFNSPDSWSPFGRGGLNTYAYCLGDPVNWSDQSGHFGNLFKGLLNLLKLRTPRMARADLAYEKTKQMDKTLFAAKMPTAPPKTTSSSIYSSARAESSSGQPSSGYASIQSYSSVDTSFAPSPHHPPPGSTRSESYFSARYTDRLPTGRSIEDIGSWVGSTVGMPNKEMTAAMQTSPTGYPTSANEHIAIQFAGQRISRNIGANTGIYARGKFLTPLDDLREKFFNKKMSQLRKK